MRVTGDKKRTFKECRTRRQKLEFMARRKVSARRIDTIEDYVDEMGRRKRRFVRRWVPTIGGQAVRLGAAKFLHDTRDEALSEGVDYQQWQRAALQKEFNA